MELMAEVMEEVVGQQLQKAGISLEMVEME